MSILGTETENIKARVGITPGMFQNSREASMAGAEGVRRAVREEVGAAAGSGHTQPWSGRTDSHSGKAGSQCRVLN